MVAHAGLTGASLHECKGVAAAAAGAIQVADGAGSASWTTLANTSVPTGFPVNASSTSLGTLVTGSDTIPFDNTIPQNTEGTEILTHSHTPRSTTNKLIIIASTMALCVNASPTLTLALFQDSVANALAATGMLQHEDWAVGLTLIHVMSAGTTSAITFKIRGGGSSGSSFNFNGEAGAQRYGGVANTNITVIEYKAS